ncbi:MAG: hypothetical protein LBF64_00600, partial [Oscillospiraceae bacterium]|nr:hypothetical protein [Oscillospiraceae bacterium]
MRQYGGDPAQAVAAYQQRYATHGRTLDNAILGAPMGVGQLIGAIETPIMAPFKAILGDKSPLDPNKATETQIRARARELDRVIKAQAEVERRQTDEAFRRNGLNPELPVLEAPATGLPVLEAPATGVQGVPVLEAPATGLPVLEAPATGVQARILDNVGKKIGVRVIIGAPTGEMGANGWYSKGEIVIASDATNPLLEVLKHEVTHRLQEAAPGEYTAYRNYAARQMALRQYNGDPAQAVAAYQQRYATRGRALTVEGALDELAADYTKHLMETPAEFERVVQDNRTLARRLFDSVVQVFRNIRAAFTGAARDSAALQRTGMGYTQLQEGLRLWENTLRAAEQVTTTAAELRAQGAR